MDFVQFRIEYYLVVQMTSVMSTLKCRINGATILHNQLWRLEYEEIHSDTDQGRAYGIKKNLFQRETPIAKSA